MATDHIFYSTGRVFRHAEQGDGTRMFSLSAEKRDVFLDYASGGGHGCKVTVPIDELPDFHAGATFRLVKMPYAEDFEALRSEDV